jgi:ABC-type multidrug transport system fused ATPase/permease subunit
MRDPAVLILDEATSQIDAESEAQISAAIDEFRRGRTLIAIAHRLSTVRSADRIVVMDQGVILDAGTHGELLSRCELYQRLVATQLVS